MWENTTFTQVYNVNVTSSITVDKLLFFVKSIYVLTVRLVRFLNFTKIGRSNLALNESRTFCPVYQLKIVGWESKQKTTIFFNLDSRICVQRIGGFLQAYYHSYDMDQSETMILTFKQRVCGENIYGIIKIFLWS